MLQVGDLLFSKRKQSRILWQIFNFERLHRKRGISLPYIQMLAQLLWRLVTNFAENFFRREKIVTRLWKSKK
jgi:hypothetical protein